jgi:hypothetical protein
MKRVWLFVLTIALQPPEAWPSAWPYGGSDLVGAATLALVSRLGRAQVVALALRSVGYGRWTAGLRRIVRADQVIAAECLARRWWRRCPGAWRPQWCLYVINHEIIPRCIARGR